MKDCTHNHTVLTRFEQSNGTYSYRFQCQACFQPVGNNQKKPDNHASLPDFNVEKREAYWEARRREFERAGQEKLDAANEEWWARYNAHMQSPEWFSLRAKVMDRAKGVCEGCGERRATQVHHMTYKRLGHEMMFDLVAVCSKCHESIHAEE